MKNDKQTLNVFDIDGETHINIDFIYDALNYKTVSPMEFSKRFGSLVTLNESDSARSDEVMSHLYTIKNNPLTLRSKPQIVTIIKVLEDELALYEKLKEETPSGFIAWIKRFF